MSTVAKLDYKRALRELYAPGRTPAIRALHMFIAEQGHELRGRHHEIYLGDPRRAAPERMKTVIRQPIA